MSYYLKELGEDDDEYSYSSEEYGEEDEYEQEYDDDEQVGEPEEQEPKPGSAIQIVSLSDKKTQQKKKSNNKVQHVLTNKKKEENVVMEITQEELDYYQQLKLYGIHGTDNKKKKNDTDGLSEQVSFKLDVLQSSKMFFESIKPSEVIIYSGNPKYEEQKKYILRHQHEISVQKPNAYRNTDEMIAGETVAPPLQTQETTHKFKAAQLAKQILNRTDQLACLSYDERYLFVYGGRTEQVHHDDLVIWDFQTGKMKVFKSLQHLSHLGYSADVNNPLPPLTNSDMVLCGNHLFLFGGMSSLPSKVMSSMMDLHFPGIWARNHPQSYKHNELFVYAIGNVHDISKIGYGLDFAPTNSRYYTEKAHPIRSATSVIVPARTHFSATKIYLGSTKVEVYLFGGKKNTNAVDDLYLYTFTSNAKQFDVVQIEKPKQQKNLVVWPSARYGHSSCLVSNLMFIFGGRNQKNDFLNDLHMYDTTSKIWTEIVCDSMLPPQLFKHQTFAVNNQSFYVYGGELKDDSERSDALYRFDIGDKKWNLIEIISEQALDEESNKALPCAGHSCFVIQGKLLRIGGIAKKGDSCVRILNMADPGRPIPLCSYLENKRDEGFLCDVVFRLRDHEQNAQHEQGIDTLSYVLAHKAIIKARCSSLHAKILQSTETMSTHRLSGTFHENCEEITLVDITDCTTHIFEQYLNFLYTGSIHLNNLDDVKAFMAYVKQTSEIHHYPFVSRICSLDERKDLGMTKQILAQLHQDFSSLINDHTYSDLVVVLDGDQGGSTVSQQAHNPPGEEIFEEEPFEIPETSFDIAPTMENGNNHDENDTAAVEIMSPLPKASSSSSNTTTNGIAVHRLIMARSPFFSRMFVTSGMLEAKEKVVHLSDYSTEVMLQVLNYLYTDTIVLTPRNCLGILVYCIMLDLVDMASCCRRMVVSLLDNSIVWSVFEIATLYNDKSLESECERYVLARYEDLCNSIGFLQLPEMTRIKIKQAFEKRKKHK